MGTNGSDTIIPLMAHGHGHLNAPAVAGPARAASRRALRRALVLIGGYTLVEVAGALVTGSLALLADAAHMLSDNLALAMALLAIRLADRPSTPQRSFGYKRAEILAALVNGLALLAVAGWILWEASRRLGDPGEVLGGGMLAVAVVGGLVNLLALRILARGADRSLNVSGAMRHVFADLISSVGVVVAAVVILVTGWNEIDPIVGALIAVLVAASALPLLRDSLRVLLEQAPADIDAVEVGRAMAAAPGVSGVHDLHVWTITSGFPALSAHVLVGGDEDCHMRRAELEELLRERFGIEHTTLQVEHERPAELLQIEGVDKPESGA